MIDLEYTNLHINGELRVAIRVVREGQTVHADTLNLLSGTGRTRFCRAVAAKFDADGIEEMAAACGYQPEVAGADGAEPTPNPESALQFVRRRVAERVEADMLAKVDDLRAEREQRAAATDVNARTEAGNGGASRAPSDESDDGSDPILSHPDLDDDDDDDGVVGGDAWKPQRLSQQANAERLAFELAGTACFHTGRGDWMVYHEAEGRFVPDATGVVARAAKRVARHTWRFLRKPPPGVDTKAAIKHAIDSEKASGIAAMMKLAQTEPGMSATADMFDRDPFLLNLLNGTVDLRTGRLRPHARDDLITKLAPVRFDPNAAAPRWSAFLQRIMGGNDTMILYLARLAGLSMTADATVQELFIPWGDGANGKSVFFDTITDMLGDYAGVAPDTLMVASQQREHPTEIAGLCGKRLVVASETEEGARLRIGLVKKMTGDKQLTGRFMRQDNFTFDRTHKMVLVTNKKPVISEDTNAIWRRVRLIPFTVVIPEPERDTQLLTKLAAERPGILNWCIAGCLDWQYAGMQTPDEVMVATAEYKADQDAVADYVAERFIRMEGARVSRNDLHADYLAWTKRTGEKHPLDKPALFERFRKQPGVIEGKWRRGDDGDGEDGVWVRGFRGIGLVLGADQTGGA